MITKIFTNWKFILIGIILITILGLKAYISYIEAQLDKTKNEVDRLHIEKRVKDKDDFVHNKVVKRFIEYQKDNEKIKEDVNKEVEQKSNDSDDSYTILATDKNNSK